MKIVHQDIENQYKMLDVQEQIFLMELKNTPAALVKILMLLKKILTFGKEKMYDPKTKKLKKVRIWNFILLKSYRNFLIDVITDIVDMMKGTNLEPNEEGLKNYNYEPTRTI